MEHITKDILIGWGACEEGVELFCEHFEKATLEEISTKCIEIGKHENAMWLYKKCRELNLFEDTTSKGYANSGNHNSGDRNSGNHNSGDHNSGARNSGNRNSGARNSGDHNSGAHNSGDHNSGDRNSGNRNSGYQNSGYHNSGYQNSGNYNSGYRNSGNRNSGYHNSGNWNSGALNSGDRNSGYQNSGNYNSGDHNSGDRNSGYQNSGNWNSGDHNSGYQNSGNWNSCNNESGYFNSQDDEYVRVFNSRVKRRDWDDCDKPDFIYEVKTNYWVPECDMTNAEKADDPDSYARGGQLRTRGYKEAWKLAYESATEDDIKLLKALPGFDSDVFEQITGVRV